MARPAGHRSGTGGRHRLRVAGPDRRDRRRSRRGDGPGVRVVAVVAGDRPAPASRAPVRSARDLRRRGRVDRRALCGGAVRRRGGRRRARLGWWSAPGPRGRRLSRPVIGRRDRPVARAGATPRRGEADRRRRRPRRRGPLAGGRLVGSPRPRSAAGRAGAGVARPRGRPRPDPLPVRPGSRDVPGRPAPPRRPARRPGSRPVDGQHRRGVVPAAGGRRPRPVSRRVERRPRRPRRHGRQVDGRSGCLVLDRLLGSSRDLPAEIGARLAALGEIPTLVTL
jgi:hypothetical protein